MLSPTEMVRAISRDTGSGSKEHKGEKWESHEMNTPHMVEQGSFCLHIELLQPKFTYFLSPHKLSRELYVCDVCYGRRLWLRPYADLDFT